MLQTKNMQKMMKYQSHAQRSEQKKVNREMGHVKEATIVDEESTPSQSEELEKT